MAGNAGIGALVDALEAAWNAQAAAAFAAPFSDDAEFIHILGGGGTGRAAIQAGHEALFRTIYARSSVDYRIARVIELGANVAVVLLNQTLRFTAGGEAQSIECRPTFVAERGVDGWRIRLFQNTQVAGKGSAGANAAIATQHPHRGNA